MDTGWGNPTCLQASATDDMAKAHALARAAAEPPLSRPGCLGSATGVAEIHRLEALFQTLGRREINVAGPRCRYRLTTPCAPRVSFHGLFGAAGGAQVR